MDWIKITGLDQLAELNSTSLEVPVLIFKHSNRCVVSKFALKNFEGTFRNEKEIPCFFIDVVSDREVSIAVAGQYDVKHESPQLLLVYQGKVVYHSSHEMIDGELVEKLVLKL